MRLIDGHLGRVKAPQPLPPVGILMYAISSKPWPMAHASAPPVTPNQLRPPIYGVVVLGKGDLLAVASKETGLVGMLQLSQPLLEEVGTQHVQLIISLAMENRVAAQVDVPLDLASTLGDLDDAQQQTLLLHDGLDVLPSCVDADIEGLVTLWEREGY